MVKPVSDTDDMTITLCHIDQVYTSTEGETSQAGITPRYLRLKSSDQKAYAE